MNDVQVGKALTEVFFRYHRLYLLISWNIFLSGRSPLHVAAYSGNTECAKKILEHKVHVGTQDGKKMTALHHAGKL